MGILRYCPDFVYGLKLVGAIVFILSDRVIFVCLLDKSSAGFGKIQGWTSFEFTVRRFVNPKFSSSDFQAKTQN